MQQTLWIDRSDRMQSMHCRFLLLPVLVLFMCFLCSGVAQASGHALSGKASWYGTTAHGKQTANGEIFNRYNLTAAHLPLPFGTVLRVHNMQNGEQILVRITDRGPFGKGRVVDLSFRSAQLLGMTHDGIVSVVMEVVAGPDGKPVAADNSFYLHLASERKVQDAYKASSKLQAMIGMPVQTLFSFQEDHAAFVLCAGPYATFRDAEKAFLKVERKHAVLCIIEGPTEGGSMARQAPPAIENRQPQVLMQSFGALW